MGLLTRISIRVLASTTDWPLNRPMGREPSRAIGCASPFYLPASYSILGIISLHKPKGRSGSESGALLKGAQLQQDLYKNILGKILYLLSISCQQQKLVLDLSVIAFIEDVNAVAGLIQKMYLNQFFVG